MASIVKEYYRNRNLKSEVFVNNGIKEGVYKEYYEMDNSLGWLIILTV